MFMDIFTTCSLCDLLPCCTGLPVIYFATGNSISTVVGSPLAITAYILSDDLFTISDISFHPVSGEPSSTPQLLLEDGVMLIVTYDHISVPPTSVYQLCLKMMNDGSAAGLMGTFYYETCSENFTLTVIGT